MKTYFNRLKLADSNSYLTSYLTIKVQKLLRSKVFPIFKKN